MGGYGSGRRRTRKLTVEECRALSIAHFPLSDSVAQSYSWGILYWKSYTDDTIACVAYNCEARGNGSAIVRLSYATRQESKGEIEEPVQAVTTRPYFGGMRWWFVCPLIVGGIICERRVRKLYLPHGGRYFGCRRCYNLTYECVRTHDNRVGRLLRNPVALLQALDGEPLGNHRVALKAAFKLMGF